MALPTTTVAVAAGAAAIAAAAVLIVAFVMPRLATTYGADIAPSSASTNPGTKVRAKFAPTAPQPLCEVRPMPVLPPPVPVVPPPEPAAGFAPVGAPGAAP